MQKLGILPLIERSGLLRRLPLALQRLQAMLPDLRGPRPHLPEVLPPVGKQRARVALFRGCVADAMFPDTNAATARVLQHNGCEVHIPRAQVCCGAIHYHSGSEAPALAMARTNLAVFNPDDYDAIIVNAAGCGAMLKDYHHVLPPAEHDRAARFVAKVKDVSEFLDQLGLIPPPRSIARKATYHDACHLCHAQKVRAQPRALLEAIPGLELVPLDESEICCGAAGTYNLTQPEMSARLGLRKMDHIDRTGADLVLTGNVGCILQIDKQARERGGRVAVKHPIDLLDEAYGGPGTAPAAGNTWNDG
jgi:glycolate oxidase iron-sulfur subunit